MMDDQLVSAKLVKALRDMVLPRGYNNTLLTHAADRIAELEVAMNEAHDDHLKQQRELFADLYEAEALLDEIAEARKYAVTAQVEGSAVEVMSVEDVDAVLEKWERRNA